MWIADSHRSREIDRAARETYGMTTAVLMERAGLAVFELLTQMAPPRGKVAVLCGKGHNGGDGFVLARLASQHQFQVECLVCATEADLVDSCRQQMVQARTQGVEPVFCDDPKWNERLENLRHKDVVVDAMLGTGVEGGLKGPVLTAVQKVNLSGVPLLAVDQPTGIHTDTGEELGDSVYATKTVTFGLPKPYLFQSAGLEHAGDWSVADIGLPKELRRAPTGARLLDAQWVVDRLPERVKTSHKGANGHVLVVAGSTGMRGAAVLAVEAAYRAGAGMVTVAGVSAVCDTVSRRVPEALLLPLEEVEGAVSPAAAEVILAANGRFDAALFGPGLTHGPAASNFLGRLWPRWEKPCCIDADAINAVALGLALPPVDCALTPHPGEIGRLLKWPVPVVQSDRFHAVRSAVKLTGKTVLLKGPYSIVGDPDEPLNVNPTGNPGMATAGMGDVLGGIVATLCAQELTPYEAASCAMFWHGAAGDDCAKDQGAIGFLARNVVTQLPRTRAKLVASCSER
ncbi:MAG: NAD(P)H-hydrate dehydratase [Fimbriimonadaceae bacterium]|nr:NAD(P)H-hydrate dehydratase [Fimbriimonadaceae bacterium]